jgi:hypothetical protein
MGGLRFGYFRGLCWRGGEDAVWSQSLGACADEGSDLLPVRRQAMAATCLQQLQTVGRAEGVCCFCDGG